MPKMVVLDSLVVNPGDLSWADFEALGELVLYEQTPPELVLERIGEAEIALTMKTPITAETVAKAPNLRYVGVLFTGYDVVDVAACRAKGITVCNVAGYSTKAVAQLELAMLLEICHGLAVHNQSVHAGDWQRSKTFSYRLTPLIELDGLRLLVLGFGAVGQAFARLAKACGMTVHYWSRSERPEAAEIGAVYEPELDKALREADVLSLNLPLNDGTRGILNAERLALLKPSAIVLNTGRGPLVDEQAMAAALRAGRLYAYCTDVLSQEPMAANCPLLGLDNCLITPHIAWSPLAARRRLLKIAAENIRAFLAGQPQNVVS